MVVMIVLLGLFTIFIPIVDGTITNSYYVHHRYNIQRAFMGGLNEGYQGSTLNRAEELFLQRFKMTAPVNFEYVVDVMNFEVNPKLLHIRVRAFDDNGIEIILEKSIVEEVLHEAGS